MCMWNLVVCVDEGAIEKGLNILGVPLPELFPTGAKQLRAHYYAAVVNDHLLPFIWRERVSNPISNNEALNQESSGEALFGGKITRMSGGCEFAQAIFPEKRDESDAVTVK